MSLTPKHPTIEAVETIIQYRFNHTALLWEALQCTGIALDSEGQAVPPGGNKRLAIVGDAVLRLVLAEEWYKGSGTTGRCKYRKKKQKEKTNEKIKNSWAAPKPQETD